MPVDGSSLSPIPLRRSSACRTCWSDLILHQPDPEMPERILGTCDECKTWYLFDVKDRPSRLFSAQQETVQRSPGWDWICTFVVAEMRASGCSILSI